MTKLRDSITELEKYLDDDYLRGSAAIEAFLRESYYRTADLFHNLVRPLNHVLKRWANSNRPGAKLLYEAAGIAVYAIAYGLLFALRIVLGCVGGGPRLPGFDDANVTPPSEKRP